MAQLTVVETVNAPTTQVWEALDDFGNIYLFNPNLTGSHLINQSEKTGLGAMRRCDLSDGKSYINERIVEYVPDRKMVVEIFEGNVPLKQAFAGITLNAIDAGRTQIVFDFEFTPKFGLLGKLMIPMMKGPFRKSLVKLLQGTKEFVETGKTVNAAA